MPDGQRLYQLVNTYSFKISEKIKVKPFFPITDNLYDSPFSVLTAIFDSRKQPLQIGTVYAKEVELNKGDYTLQLQMEHSSYKVLDSHKSMALTLEVPLGDKLKKLTLEVDRGKLSTLHEP
jgi:tripeptidyl-peptidase-2